MRSYFFLFAMFTVLGLTLLQSYSSGPANQGVRATGAPGESSTRCTQCHTGGNFGTMSIDLSLVNSAGDTVVEYLPDSVYTAYVTVSNSDGTPAGYGFQMICLQSGSNSNLQGWSNPSSNARLSVSNSRNYVEHKALSTTNLFSVNWKAPASGTGEVDFYIGANAVNGNGATSGDKAVLSDFSLSEASVDTVPPTGIKNQTAFSTLSIFPNPATSDLMIHGLRNGEFVEIISMDGQVMLSENFNGQSLNISEYPAGIYYILTQSGVSRFMKL